MMTLEQFARQLQAALRAVKPELGVGLDKVGRLAATLAAEYPGTYQEGWPALAASTIDDKTKNGWPVPSPLKRTGEMADSVKMEVEPAELEMAVGSNDLVALWQEMGTSRGIPPRSFLGLGMKNSLPYAADVFGETAVALLTGKK